MQSPDNVVRECTAAEQGFLHPECSEMQGGFATLTFVYFETAVLSYAFL